VSAQHKGTKEQEGTKLKEFEPIPRETERIAKVVVDAAFKGHSSLGPGLLETVYKACFVHELQRRQLVVESEVAIPINYEGLLLGTGLRLDVLIEKQIIVELKAVEKLVPLFEAQLLSYLRLSRLRLGLLINFNVPLIKNGIKRIVL
jgi:GxxExxY protein